MSNARHGHYEGALQILRFNAGKYIAAAGSVLLGLFLWPFLPLAGRVLLVLTVCPAIFWMVSSLLVSHYIYDRFPIYDFRPIANLLTNPPQRWLNIHSGLDESSEALCETFPGSAGQTVDMFDDRLMTEASIRRARRMAQNGMPAQSVSHDALPFEAASFDVAFTIFAAHELRDDRQRVRLLREVQRVLKAGGQFVMMEHRRDWVNFLAFGPGCFHFFSHPAWRSAIVEAGLQIERELAMTPFVHVYIAGRN